MKNLNLYQKRIIEFVQHREHDALVISAGPGTGKSFTLLEVAKSIPEEKTVLMTAFNTSAADDLLDRVRPINKTRETSIEACTLHSYGRSILTGNDIKIPYGDLARDKYQVIIRRFITKPDTGIFYYEDLDPYIHALGEFLDKLRLTWEGLSCSYHEGSEEYQVNLEYEATKRMINRFDIALAFEHQREWEQLVRITRMAINEGARKTLIGQIDFNDMIFAPILMLHKWHYIPRYDYVLVDESQDLNSSLRKLALLARKPDAMFVAVGDRRQSIYGFSGAHLQSIDEIISETGAVELPLSVCYRCPTEVIKLANSIYPGLEACEQAPQGAIEHIENTEIEELAEAGDAILSRCNAPLVDMALSLLRRGKRCYIMGRSGIGSQVTEIIDRIKKKFKGRTLNFAEFELALNAFKEQESAKTYDAEKATLLFDKIETLVILLESYKRYFHNPDASSLKPYISTPVPSEPTFAHFQQTVNNFFDEDKSKKKQNKRQKQLEENIKKKTRITLATGHKAKGQEWKNVFIISWPELPHKRAKTPEEIQQEHNLRYVLVTRTLFEKGNTQSGRLYLGYDPKKETEEQQHQGGLLILLHPMGSYVASGRDDDIFSITPKIVEASPVSTAIEKDSEEAKTPLVTAETHSIDEPFSMTIEMQPVQGELLPIEQTELEMFSMAIEKQEKRKKGRPVKNQEEKYIVKRYTIPPKQQERIDARAKELGLDVSAFIRLLTSLYDEQKTRIDFIFQEEIGRLKEE